MSKCALAAAPQAQVSGQIGEVEVGQYTPSASTVTSGGEVAHQVLLKQSRVPAAACWWYDKVMDSPSGDHPLNWNETR